MTNTTLGKNCPHLKTTLGNICPKLKTTLEQQLLVTKWSKTSLNKNCPKLSGHKVPTHQILHMMITQQFSCYAMMLIIACNGFMTLHMHTGTLFFYSCMNSSISYFSSSVKITSQQFLSVSRIRIFGIFDIISNISESSATCLYCFLLYWVLSIS